MSTPVLVGDAGSLPTTRQMGWALASLVRRYYIPLGDGHLDLLARSARLRGPAARRRLPPELAASRASLAATPELVRLLAGRFWDRSSYELIWRRNHRFDRALARRVEPHSLLIGQYGACLSALRETRRRGGRVVLDHPIGELNFGRAILEEEIALRPEFADTIVGPGAQLIRPAELARISDEVDEADLVVVGSAFAAGTFDGRVERDRLAVVPYGSDTSLFTPREGPRPPGPLRVLFAGQLSQRKGFAYLLDAMERLDPRRFELTVAGALVGAGRWYPAHRGRFRHLAGLSTGQMPDVYRAADVLVLPSLLEGSAVVVLEALAAGVPVIVTPNAGADAVSDGVEGFVLPIRDADAIAERLERLEADADLLARMSEAGRRRAEQGLDWVTFRTRFRELLTDRGLIEDGAGRLAARSQTRPISQAPAG